MPSINQLRYVVAVDANRHFAKAAAECHVSQPSLSAQIQKLEAELDVVIFDRTRKPILTTDRGRLIVDQAKAVLREHRKLLALRGTGADVEGEFVLGVIPTLSPYLVPLFATAFSENYPKVRLTISEYKTDDIVRHLKDDRIDGGLLVTPLNDDEIIERSLFFEPFYAFIADGHPMLDEDELVSDELDAKSAWLLDEGHCFRSQMLKLCSLESRNRVLENVNFESGSLETLVNLIRRGSGYTLLPELAAARLSEGERQSNLRPFSAPIPTREVSLVHSRGLMKHEIIEALERQIIDVLPANVRSLKRGDVTVVEI